MLTEPTYALVLRTRDWMNTSLIVDFYTEKLGRVVATCRGARRLALTTQGTIQTLTIGEAIFNLTKKGTVSLRTFYPVEYLAPLDGDLRCFLAAETVSEHMLVATPQMVADKKLWGYGVAALRACRDGADAVSVAAAYLLCALKNEGVLPGTTCCNLCKAPLPQTAFCLEDGRFACSACARNRQALRVEPALISALASLDAERLSRLKLGTKRAAHLLLLADALLSVHFQLTLRTAHRLASLIL